jgi:TetR/AcrR family transcriptional regulator, cholesterol catabolism regulator
MEDSQTMTASRPAPRRGRPPGRPAKTREEITLAAAGCFRRLGYQRARMDDVAEALGITKGSLYYYVPSKEQLLFDIILPPYRDAVAHLDEVLTSIESGPRRLSAVISRHLANVERYYPAVSVYVENMRTLPVPPEMRDLDVAYIRGLRRIVLEGVQDGSLRTVDSGIAVVALLGMLNGLAVNYHPDQGWEIPQIVTEVSALCLDGLATARRRRQRRGEHD